MSLPVVILCGGKGTRLGEPINKCFVDVNGKPFLLHQLERLEAQGYTTTILARGNEGTLPAVREAAFILGVDRFLVIYGDTLLSLDLADFEEKWDLSGRYHATAIYDGIDAGVNGVSTLALDALGSDVTDFAAHRDYMDYCGHLYRYEAPERWLEVGTPEALAETRSVLQ
jgi:NDP-sugar pyrophosphorylase family protein